MAAMSPLQVVRALALAILPATAVWELIAVQVQHRHVPKRDDWGAAASAAIAAKQPGDVIIVAPRWAEQHGRMATAGFRVPRATTPETPLDPMFDVRVAARADLETVTRALELSIRRKDDPQTKGWTLVSEQKFGDVSLRILQNPAPQKLLRDLIDEIDPTATVSRVANGVADPCRWEETGTPHMPGLFAGAVQPTRRFFCSPFDPAWTYVGETVITDLQYMPRRCIWMHPGANDVTTIELPPRPIGKRFVAYLGIQVYQERELKWPPVYARASVGGKEIIHITHTDGEGWMRYEGSTADFAGTSQPVKIELWTDPGMNPYRTACMAAQLRD
jgi:hypothetical protein